MKVLIKRFDKSLPLPEYKTKGAAAFDLHVREETVISPNKVVLVPLNIAIQLPENHWALLSARSSLHKMGLMVANGIGVGDYDYRGDGDEYKAALLNFTDEEVVLKKGDRVVQMIIMTRDRVEFEEKEKFSDQNRGGFGSTGK
jgi:dUTP pyrophosphatase